MQSNSAHDDMQTTQETQETQKAQEASLSGSDQETQEARQSQRQHILVVNHDPALLPALLDVVRILLQEERYNVTTTNYVPHTWERIVALQPSLLLIDLASRSQAGWDLLEQLHAEGVTEHIPIIVTSSDRRILARVDQEPNRFGADRLITKPLDVNDLLEAIRTLIGPA